MRFVGALVLLVCVSSGIVAAVSEASECDDTACTTITLASHVPRNAPVESIGGPLPGRPVSPGFIGLSIEYYAVQPYAGRDPHALNPVFLQLVRNLNPGQSPVLRIGGDSADWARVPSADGAMPAGARVAITPNLVSVLAAVGARLNGKFILGLDLEANSARVAREEALRFLGTIGPAHIGAMEIGNEPELYDVLGWYAIRGRPVLGRRPGYSISDYEREFAALAKRLPPLPLAGPASGRPAWTGDIGRFTAAVPRVAVVTVHRYPLQRCQIEPGTPRFPTVAELLAAPASVGLADSVARDTAAAHAHGRPIRVDEINSVACFGAHGVSDTFAAALWTLETSLEMARIGVDGLNFHTLPAANYGLFNFQRTRGRWSGQVAPDYYGLLTFARVAPPGSRLLRTAVGPNGLRTWATETPAGTIHVVLVNTGRSTRTVGVRIPAAHGLAGLSYLRARTLSSSSVTLDHRTFGGSTSSGILSGGLHTKRLVIQAVNGLYVVRVPSPSAALLTVAPQRSTG